MRTTCNALGTAILLLLVLAGRVDAKGDGIGLGMVGKVSDVRADGKNIRLVLKGHFVLVQYAQGEKSRVEVDCSRGCPAAVRQANPFFAMSTDGRAGAIQADGGLLRILKAAAEKQRSISLEVTDASLVFAPDGSFTVTKAGVIRATDADLK